MAKEVRWTKVSIVDRFDIYNYWIERTKSEEFSIKLDLLFVQAASLISDFPEIGMESEVPGIRIKIVKNYKIFYLNNEDNIQILRVWDAKQDPKRLIF
ncbi:type II toxin-antitoxin system RelE/ParE family toxin [Anditalea andensis]|uniref:Addiction module toxin RelE n=1 Tax=Anditalea andensis TaxID=1048983 RepID=A0A074L382_9BACT|nr:type II toxin-antitoxin system RelE/ParE family toxin [Anditalea andensis]KEO74960.1 hypothetical protein EL17_04595 [Anditalea andensis]